ncbi:hypothetical protein [Streptomyces sp. NPDC086182]|jgi:hypothetical protein|uniref:hypothetical protein n=1 Tax=Streptomyces sp. NPDC086182 TaxID=3155058 RepID=UPI00342FE583
MKRLLAVLGLAALVQGVLGLVQEITGRPHGWGLVRRLGFLDGHEIYASATLLVLAVALFAAAGSRRSG